MKKENTVCVVVAAHKPYPMPEDPMYLPLHVGAEGKTDGTGAPLDLGYARDDTGSDHISGLNAGFCELTGLYWAWKNRPEDYIGLVHYRRHFASPDASGHTVQDVLKERELLPLTHRYSIFVPVKRKYRIETLYSHYAHTHYAEQLDEVRSILAGLFPEYLPSCDKVFGRTWGYMFNMAIMRRDLMDAYCSWLFAILFELKNALESGGKQKEQLSAYQGRLYGRVSEILFNVWLDHQILTGSVKAEDVLELPYFNTERTNWLRKGTAFLMARFLHKRYEGSF